MKKHSVSIEETFRERGFRVTAGRLAVATALMKSTKPLSADELLASLTKKGPSVNRTTVYRELEFLVSEQLAHSIDFGDGKIRYEMGGTHHHHVVCTSCSKVAHVDIESDIAKLQLKLGRSSGMKINRHQVEFFGTCTACRA